MKQLVLCTLAFALLAACGSPRKAERKFGTTFFQHWTHSHEDDKNGLRVYRPSTYNFPLSRGREGFEIMSDGTLKYYAIAASDGIIEKTGTWKLKSKNLLVFLIDGRASYSYVIKADGEQLVLGQ